MAAPSTKSAFHNNISFTSFIPKDERRALKYIVKLPYICLLFSIKKIRKQYTSHTSYTQYTILRRSVFAAAKFVYAKKTEGKKKQPYRLLMRTNAHHKPADGWGSDPMRAVKCAATSRVDILLKFKAKVKQIKRLIGTGHTGTRARIHTVCIGPYGASATQVASDHMGHTISNTRAQL